MITKHTELTRRKAKYNLIEETQWMVYRLFGVRIWRTEIVSWYGREQNK